MYGDVMQRGGKDWGMTESKELKPKSFRIDDETARKFKEISENIGGNQQEAMAKLIEAYEFQAGKAVLTVRRQDIDKFESYVMAMTRMYMGSLEDCQNMAETIRSEFDALLKSKDSIIQDLQEKITLAKQLKEESSAKAKAHADENAHLKKEMDDLNVKYEARVEELCRRIEDKDNLNEVLQDSCKDYKTKLEGLLQEHEDYMRISEELEASKAMCKDLELLKSQAEDALDRCIADYKKNAEELEQKRKDELEQRSAKLQLAFEQEKLALEKRYQEQIQALKEQKQVEIDKYQQNYFNLLEQIKGSIPN